MKANRLLLVRFYSFEISFPKIDHLTLAGEHLVCSMANDALYKSMCNSVCIHASLFYYLVKQIIYSNCIYTGTIQCE